jgi:hypothetical protein
MDALLCQLAPGRGGQEHGGRIDPGLEKTPALLCWLRGPTHTPRVLVAASALVAPWHPVLFIGSGLSIGSVLFAAKWR